MPQSMKTISFTVDVGMVGPPEITTDCGCCLFCGRLVILRPDFRIQERSTDLFVRSNGMAIWSRLIRPLFTASHQL